LKKASRCVWIKHTKVYLKIATALIGYTAFYVKVKFIVGEIALEKLSTLTRFSHKLNVDSVSGDEKNGRGTLRFLVN